MRIASQLLNSSVPRQLVPYVPCMTDMTKIELNERQHLVKNETLNSLSTVIDGSCISHALYNDVSSFTTFK